MLRECPNKNPLSMIAWNHISGQESCAVSTLVVSIHPFCPDSIVTYWSIPHERALFLATLMKIDFVPTKS